MGRPSIGFCNELLLGSKYERDECGMPFAVGLIRTAQEGKLHSYLTSNTFNQLLKPRPRRL